MITRDWTVRPLREGTLKVVEVFMVSFAFLLCHFHGFHFNAVADWFGQGASKVLFSEATNFEV